jgi:hypothetical protein
LARAAVVDQPVHRHAAGLEIVVQQSSDRQVDLVAVALRRRARE